MLNEIPEIIKIVESIDQRKENRLKPKTKVNHMNTRTTKQTMQITDAMNKELSKIGEEIVKLLDRNISFEKIKQKLNTQVGSVIASGIRESYLLGFHFIEKFEQRTIKLSDTHLEEINTEIKKQIDNFWKAIVAIIADSKKKQKKKSSKTAVVIASAAGPNDLLLLNLFDNYFSRSAISMGFFALNQGTITTQRQVFKETVQLNKNSSVTVTGSITVPQSIWISERDGRVCPTCKNLDGRTWGVDDNKMPRPVQDSHLGCRCRLLPLDNGRVFNA